MSVRSQGKGRAAIRLEVATHSSYYYLRRRLNRDYNCDSTTIRLRYDDTTTHSTTTEVIEITIRMRYDYDKTMTKN